MQLMTPDKAHDTPLSEQAQGVLRAVQSSDGDWMKRSAIARAMDKKRLNPYEVAQLSLLIEKELVEVKQEPDNTPIGYVYLYRATGQED